MSTVKIEEKEIPTSGFDQTCLFKQYFNNENVFKYSHKHNFNYKSWFEMAEGELLEVRQILYGFFQRLKKSDKLPNYCSVERTEVDSSNTLKSSVTNQLRGTDNNYLAKKSRHQQEGPAVGNRQIIAEPVGMSTVDTSGFHIAMLNKNLSNEY